MTRSWCRTSRSSLLDRLHAAAIFYGHGDYAIRFLHHVVRGGGRVLEIPTVYLLPLMPVLVLILARACQLTWRRSRLLAAAGAVAYLLPVGRRLRLTNRGTEAWTISELFVLASPDAPTNGGGRVEGSLRDGQRLSRRKRG